MDKNLNLSYYTRIPNKNGFYTRIEFEKFVSENIPLGRIGKADEVADLAFAFSTQEFSKYSTGVRINLDGGTSINL